MDWRNLLNEAVSSDTGIDAGDPSHRPNGHMKAESCLTWTLLLWRSTLGKSKIHLRLQLEVPCSLIHNSFICSRRMLGESTYKRHAGKMATGLGIVSAKAEAGSSPDLRQQSRIPSCFREREKTSHVTLLRTEARK